MDDDGLAASFKAIRDGIADKVQVNDGNPALVFRYTQEKSKSYGIEIEILSPTVDDIELSRKVAILRGRAG